MLVRRHPARAGYTLLEILLASAIALILLAALYVAMDITLVRMDANRELVNANDFSRAVFNRLSSDLTASLGVLPPNSGGANAAETAAASEAATTETDPSTTAPADPEAMPVVNMTNLNFQAGVIGADRSLTLFTSRVPLALVDAEVAAAGDLQLPGDLQRVTYYLGTQGGLCRQVRPWVTADGVGNVVEPDYTTEDVDLIAPEVLDITFEYFDGGVWLGEWDGSAMMIDGVTLQGPPRAIRVTLVLEVTGRGNVAIEKTVQKVFVIRAAAGTYTPPTSSTDTTTPPEGTMP